VTAESGAAEDADPATPLASSKLASTSDDGWSLAIPAGVLATAIAGIVVGARRRRRTSASAAYPLTFPAYAHVPLPPGAEPTTPGTWESCHDLPMGPDFEISFSYRRKDTAAGW
jgi:hypothetical protein